MDLKILHGKNEIFKYLEKCLGLQIYLIGDLDDFFWPKTIWFALKEFDEIKAIALLYIGMAPPTLLSFYEGEAFYYRILLEKIKPFLPNKLNMHTSPNLLDVFCRKNILKYYGLNYKMLLKKEAPDFNNQNIRKLSMQDLNAIKEFYIVSYPQNWFDSRMLETNKYFGYFIENKLVGVSGIHVYSEQYRVAALGNIATHPDFRGQKIAYQLTSALCSDLQKSVDYIGLNVNSENKYAIQCYRKIGFEIIGEYDECFLKNKPE